MKKFRANKYKITRHQSLILAVGIGSAILIFFLGVLLTSRHKRNHPAHTLVYNETIEPMRSEPKHFPAGSTMPARTEGSTSGSIDLNTFSAGRDLVYFDDPRVFFESDHDNGDTEDDHSMNVVIVKPLKILIELVCANGGTLEIQDAYRATGIHSLKSLHREGRALDLTCDQFSLEKLACLCWAAGFDWVYYETKGGAHIHVSVKRNSQL